MDTDAIREQLAESRFYAARGERPPTREIRDTVAVQNTLVELCRRAASEFLEVHDPTTGSTAGPPPGHHQSMLDIDRAMMRRGVTLRLLRPLAAPTGDYLPRVRAEGAGVRLFRSTSPKLTIVDRRVAMLPRHPGTQSFREGALLITDPSVVVALTALHRTVWQSSSPLEGAAPPHLAPVLDLVLAGIPDVAAARRLNISPRTYTRRVAELLDLLGARSRAMAGAAAERRGWLR
ncbi:hypothetical protein [Cryptosporangium sp. NPDC048952]|uniref:helix-turn-helix transcriptional regulator n=1 Tax=Cryptosporangium sp. NPDC048952 TaxID=3363961 RepID=UPI00371E2363